MQFLVPAGGLGQFLVEAFLKLVGGAVNQVSKVVKCFALLTEGCLTQNLLDCLVDSLRFVAQL